MPSSVVAAMHYDEQKKVLRIVYTSGAVYDYKNVPAPVYEQMRASGSKGTFLNLHIKGEYPFEKVS